MSLEMETLSLPADYSFGKITVYPPGELENPQLLDARGPVEIPKGAKLFLDASQELCDNLSSIHLVPKRLLANGVTFSEKNLDKANFGELRAVEPSCIVIRSCHEIRIGQFLQLGKLTSVEHLNLSYTPLDALDFSWIPQFPNLKTLLLVGMGADDNCLVFLTDLRHLEDLHLTHSKISDRGVQTIWRMARLKGVNFGACPIGDKAVEGLACCSSLCSLDVSDTRITDRGVEVIVTEALRTGQPLASLSLRSCRITDKSLVRLASLKHLILLDLFSTEVTPEGAGFLKRSLPGCSIFVGQDKGGGPRLWEVDQA